MNRLRDWAPLPLRLALGIVLIAHGLPKWARGIDQFGAALDQMGFPLPLFLAVGVALLEVVGGLMLILGLFTRIIAALATVQFLIILLVVRPLGQLPLTGDNGNELELMLFLGSLSLALSGAGALALDRLIFRRRRERARPVAARRQPEDVAP
ncbi:MAG: DoxX family protein [Candidatus Zixiibacteriota bacterium]|nr:MAG: DoxX family protein [candidate division Zixibacteria bacterium]